MMKKIFTLLTITSLTMAFAQETEFTAERKTEFGVTGKIHQSNIRGIHDYSKPRIAGSLGGFAQIPLNKKSNTELYVVPVLEFSMEGERAEPTEGEQKFNNNYINLPIYLKYYFGFGKENANKNIFVMAGPKVGFAVSDKTDGALYLAQDVIAENNFKKFNIALSVGAGYRLNPNIEGFVRYDHGLSKAYGNYTIANTYNYQIGAGINYFLK